KAQPRMVRSIASGVLELAPFFASALTSSRPNVAANRVTTSSCSLNRSATFSSNRSAQRWVPFSPSISCALTRNGTKTGCADLFDGDVLARQRKGGVSSDYEAVANAG